MFGGILDSTHAINIKCFVLDPMSVIVKLAILANKPVGTKITIQHNAIKIDEYSIFQGWHRFVNGHTKSDLHYLYNPVQIACVSFLTDDTKHLFESAKKGLSNLNHTYKQYSIVTVCLNYYDSIIGGYIKKLERRAPPTPTLVLPPKFKPAPTSTLAAKPELGGRRGKNRHGGGKHPPPATIVEEEDSDDGGDSDEEGGKNDTVNYAEPESEVEVDDAKPPSIAIEGVMQHHDNMTSLYTSALRDQLNVLWSKNKLKIIVEMNQFLSTTNTASAHDVSALENIMQTIDAEAREIIQGI